MNANFRANVPQLYVDVDRAAAKARGVALGDVFGTLQALMSTLYVNDFNLYGKTYRVQIEAQAPYRQRPQDLDQLYVRGKDDVMLPDLDVHPRGIPQRAHAHHPLQRVHVGARDGRAQGGTQFGRDDERDR